jgi:GTP-binding protein HflX
LTESQLYAADKLFATLDSVTRKNSVTGLDDILFSDTVGFISNLPTELIESFKATLDELKSADLLVHVVDISDPDFIYKTEQVSLILKELGISDIPCIRVNNKSDKVDMEINGKKVTSSNTEVWMSALNNIGMNDLINSIQLNRKKSMVKEWVELQPNQGKIRAQLYSLGRVLEETTSDTGLIQLQLEIDEKELGNLISDKDINLKKNNIKEVI